MTGTKYMLLIEKNSVIPFPSLVLCKLRQCCVHVMSNSMTFVLLNENVDNLLDSDEIHSLPGCSNYE